MKDLDFQPNQSQQPDQLMLTKLVKITKSRLNEIQSRVTEGKKNKLETKTGNKVLTLNNAEIFFKEIASRKINKNESIKMYENVISEANLISDLIKTNKKKEYKCALAQFPSKAGNNSEKLKNEIRQLLHLLYRSKSQLKSL